MLATLTALLLAQDPGGAPPPAPCAPDSISAAAIATAVAVFREIGDRVWPGFDPATMPIVFYSAGRWALEANVPGRTDTVSLGAVRVAGTLRCGPTRGLVGQLAFDHAVGDTRTVAVPLPISRRSLLQNYGFVAHEAFHQLQPASYRRIEIPSEDAYPILDTANTALVALEMRVLADAIRALDARDSARVRDLAATFAAVRARRWGDAGDEVRAFEDGMELVEGVARYIEVKSVGALLDQCRREAASARTTVRCPTEPHANEREYLLADFRTRLHAGSLPPQDVARNRIYTEGAAMGLLLDALGVRWRERAFESNTFSIAGALMDAAPLGHAASDRAVEAAAREHGLDSLRRAAARLAGEYVSAYTEARRTFDADTGVRIEVSLPAAMQLVRSRAFQEPRWVMERGAIVFCPRYTAYTFGGPADSASIQLRGLGALEETRGGTRRTEIVAPAVTSIEIDGRPIDAATDGTHAFRSLRLTAPDLMIRLDLPGTLVTARGRVSVRLESASR